MLNPTLGWTFSLMYILRIQVVSQLLINNFLEVLLYIRAIEGPTGGNGIAPELTGHVIIPFESKEFLLHRGCSNDVTSTLKSGRVAGGSENKEPLNPFVDNPDRRRQFMEAEKSPQTQQVEVSSERRLLDQPSPSRRKGTTVLADVISCHSCLQLCAGSLHRA